MIGSSARPHKVRYKVRYFFDWILGPVRYLTTVIARESEAISSIIPPLKIMSRGKA